ncbi:helix-turn-helix domain-containing protein [Legionella sp.]|uniref:helix-turn-helix domain-containing protein n=1 Tax=Legionella sp. TaxID=459 RepID=UPI00321FE5C8
MVFKANRPAEELGNPKSIKPPYDNSASTQRKRTLSYLEKYHRLSTIEAREKLGVLHPCGRVKELRAKGYLIETHWIKAPDANGVFHRIGLYVYQGKQEVPYEKQ